MESMIGRRGVEGRRDGVRGRGGVGVLYRKLGRALVVSDVEHKWTGRGRKCVTVDVRERQGMSDEVGDKKML